MHRRSFGAPVAGLLLATACAPLPPAADARPWQPLLDGRELGAFAPTAFGGEGPVTCHGDHVELGMGSPLTGIHWSPVEAAGAPLPTGDYEMELQAARLLGNDFFCGLTFPVGNGHLTLVLGGWGGAVCGLSSLDGKDAAHNETRCHRGFATGRWYHVTLHVTTARVAARIDGEPLLTCALTGRQLSLRPEMLESRPLGFASFATTAAVRNWRWRPLPTASGVPLPASLDNR